ncbi:lipopolysaccharide biosynthesis protein [Synechococcus sp. RSCCF101]|uniref:oligosaccharide flippase family protein n=1 Tax=Synechococcus sp. RSCCF101 TaxID=2511069 RepID=UPI0012455B19|nr:oligosaccharide flippase family protein [Synechococcus sp. RSCCF101]QEY31472.1 lipopolysaccharide biosynthesis protein [Synechococcus sp. RSCCF101]
MQRNYLRNISWTGAAEIGVRVTRLFATAVLARFLTENDYGLAALVLSVNELLVVFTRNGIVDRLVQLRNPRQVDELIPTAFSLSLVLSLLLCLGSVVAAAVMVRVYQQEALFWPIVCISVGYLFIPFSVVPTSLIMIDNQLKPLSLTVLVSIGTDNMLSALLAYQGFGLWAIVLPKILITPIWPLMLYRFRPWPIPKRLSFTNSRILIGFSSKILGSELLTTFQSNLDYLLIGLLLSTAQLGLYYFAFNAGLGFSLALISTLMPAFYTDLCEARQGGQDMAHVFRRNLRIVMKIFIPFVLLQVVVAPLYVPILFGQRWVEDGAVPVLQLICLSALSRPFAVAVTSLVRAIDRPRLDLQYQVVLTVVLVIGVLAGARYGILGVAAAVCAAHWLVQGIYYLWASRRLLAAPAS